ncbi:hypothetical protein Xmau_01199 [Xenorhabdus mauleonii]|uniref:5-bromo-4-chloroindolyl phosphate hydrolysis protein n=1 Tax=Xenorhabdus mauleonii TaxID=351675 RepID=A0A1I3KAU9_9GAMM|nr:5-bromo-4-chloroindolyl phosphate hydrolysis family protein [Xenorhabdus mauleonii]PHM44994.1 hypothetical protein Xmau_01199 [Xenorhabdus mauleonii]SFI69612.1 5-bromo-4-chloroindolyl phosphate hydrolysis protein [Xenorhabdus mauleonii]
MSSIVDKIKAFFLRLLFHFIGLFAGGVISQFFTHFKWGPLSDAPLTVQNDISGLISISGYLGIMALFAPRREKYSSNVWHFAIMLTLCGVANALPAYLLFAGFAVLLIKAKKKILTKGRLFLLVISGLMIANWMIHDSKLIPLWFSFAYVVAVAFLFYMDGRKMSKNDNVAEPPKAKAPVETDKAPPAFSQYTQQLALIMAYQPAVPQDVWPYLKKIEEKTRAIINSMKEDERDIQPGTAFLNRYLPMIKNALESLASLNLHQANSPQFQEAKLLTIQGLQEMGEAFSEMHQNLLDNNIDDLMADLKSMSQLVQSQGFDVKK